MNQEIYNPSSFEVPQPVIRIPEPSYPGWVKGFVITDLVLCCMRLAFGFLGIVGFFVISPDDPIYRTALFEIISAFGIALSGIPGDILLLLRKRFGIILGVANCGFTILNIAVGLWQALLNFGDKSGPELIGFFIGASMMTIFRTGILSTYIFTLFKANKILSE